MKKTLVVAGLALVTAVAALPGDGGWAEATQDRQARRERRQQRQAARRQDAEEWRRAWTGLSAADRAALASAWRDNVDRNHDHTPEERARYRAAAERLEEQLRNLSPEQKARLQDRLRQSAEAYAELTAEQKEALLAGMADTVERLKALTPAQRASLRALYRKLLGL